MRIYSHIKNLYSLRTKYSRDDVLLRKAKISLKHLSDHTKRDIGLADGNGSKFASDFLSRKAKQVMGW